MTATQTVDAHYVGAHAAVMKSGTEEVWYLPFPCGKNVVIAADDLRRNPSSIWTVKSDCGAERGAVMFAPADEDVIIEHLLSRGAWLLDPEDTLGD